MWGIFLHLEYFLSLMLSILINYEENIIFISIFVQLSERSSLSHDGSRCFLQMFREWKI
jgi:hypothetical protein